MATTKNVLVMEFQTPTATRSIRVTDPKDDLTSEQVQSVMETLVDLNAFFTFVTDGGAALKGAKKVSTVTDKFEITIE